MEEKEKDHIGGYYKMTFSKLNVPKNRILKWLFWNVYWKVWNIWRPSFLAWFFNKLSNLFKNRYLK